MTTGEILEMEKRRKEFAKNRKRQFSTDRSVVERDGVERGVERVPKRKVALLMGYCGTGYKGMQFNPGAKTIEADLWQALVQTECVSTLNADDPRKVSFMRAARTDKGVHALGQVCSMMLQRVENLDTIQGPELERRLVKEINEKLPEQIRVWGIIKMPRSFQAKNSCDSRWYEYVMPTYLFANPRKAYYPESNLSDDGDVHYPFPHPGNLDASDKRDERMKYFSVSSTSPEQISKLKEYRMTPAQVEMLRQGIAKYKGTHNFWNYTVNKRFEEPNSKRHLLELKVSDPFVRDGQEWVSVRLWGQSFMLHQIRKMVGMVAMIIRTNSSLDVMNVSFTKTRFNIPKAPSVGLLLDRVVYKAFNERLERMFGQRKQSLKDQGHEVENGDCRISFDKYDEEMAAFRDAFIYPKVFAEDARENTFLDWMRSVDAHGPEYMWYLRSDGSVKEEDRPSWISVHKISKENEKSDSSDEHESS